MAKDRALTDPEKKIRDAQNDALILWPEDVAKRNAFIDGITRAMSAEKEAVSKAKSDTGVANAKKALIETRGFTKPALAFILKLESLDPVERAKTMRQVIQTGEDRGYILRDLFDEGAIGVGASDVKGETAGFDATSEGQRRGGKAAQPRATEQMAASNAAPAREIPSIPLDQALANYEAEKAKAEGKRGPKPKSLKEAEATYLAAKAAADQPEVEETKADEPGTATPAKIAEEEASNVVSFAQQQREANREGDEMIREQSAKMQQERQAKAAAAAEARKPKAEETAAKAPDKPKRSRVKKADAAKASAEPPPPPDDDDNDGDDDGDEGDFRGTPSVGIGQVGDQPADFTVGY